MNCILLFNYLLILLTTTLLSVGLITPYWLVYDDHFYGITEYCIRLYRIGNTDRYSNLTKSSIEAHLCSNNIVKWYKNDSQSILPDYKKVLIGVCIASVFISVVALILTHITVSFRDLKLSKRVAEFLLGSSILTVVLALVVVGLFLGFEKLQLISNYGYSFWVYVAGSGTMFICCILSGIYRIDVEFEFRRYRQDSVATLC
ncbi:unnamed protein product [Didymodactylos carnosus]|uniref:Uncharacterized protein n=1 Tax=Didymodactylos carnosus TaxID=1234261 RepID=A0A814DG16_9BILA|nr:unnamed protein product [Didymodactylos carnosus]CAF0957419.1 unnamed protein product [Didymodactylos carnosus]CAF3730456.1 unnamed protein product [Didymodactylos carnosus]CAF3730503.1 unnamed protein product [Didymodactylos carnosus]